MPYGTIKIDTVTFTDAGVDKSVTLSGLVQNPTFSGSVTVTGTLSGVTVTGTTANFTSGNFTNISGGTHTITSGVFAAGSAASPSITFTGDLNTGIYSPGADQVAISTNGTGRLFVDSNGNLGVGISSVPNYNANLRTVSFNNTNGVVHDYAVNGIRTGSIVCQSTALELSTQTNVPLVFSTNSAERMRLDSSGRLGVGTSSPTTTLDCRGVISTNDAIYCYNTARDGLGIWYNPGGAGVNQLTARVAGGDRLTIDSSGRVGVGTTSPSQKFEIGGSGRSTLVVGSTNSFAELSLTGATTENYITSDDTLAFYVNNAERLRIDTSGRVGIGTSSVSSLLHLASSGPVLTLQRSDSASPGAAINFTNNTSGVNWQIGTNQAVGGSAFEINSGNQANNRFVITSGGLVGIGNTTAGSYNAGFNQLVVGSSGDQGVTIVSGTSNSGTLAFADGTSGADAYRGYVQYQHGSTNALVFATDGSERFRCDSSGRLLVGTSSYSGNGKVAVAGNTGGNAGALDICWAGSRPTTAGTDIGYIRWYSADNSSSNAHYASIYATSDGDSSSGSDIPGRLVFSTTADGASSPTERMRIKNTGDVLIYSTNGFNIASSSGSGTSSTYIDAFYGATGVSTGTRSFIVYTNGNVLNTNNSYGALSDAKLKENIVDANSQWDDIKALQVRNYNFKEGQTHTQIGLIAQEVELVSPGLVTESPDRDEDGNDLGTVTKSVNYSVLYMKAVKALQEAMERIETLEAKVAALESA